MTVVVSWPLVWWASKLIIFSYILYSWCSGIWSLYPDEDESPRAHSLLGQQTTLRKCSALTMLCQLIPSLYSQPSPLSNSRTLRQYRSCPKSPRPRYSITRDHHYTTWSSAYSEYLSCVSLIPPVKTSVKVLDLFPSPASWQTRVSSRVTLCGLLSLLFLDMCEYKLILDNHAHICTTPDENRSLVQFLEQPHPVSIFITENWPKQLTMLSQARKNPILKWTSPF